MTYKTFTARSVNVANPQAAVFAGRMDMFAPKSFRDVYAVTLFVGDESKPGIKDGIWSVQVDQDTLDKAIKRVQSNDPQYNRIEIIMEGSAKSATAFSSVSAVG